MPVLTNEQIAAQVAAAHPADTADAAPETDAAPDAAPESDESDTADADDTAPSGDGKLSWADAMKRVPPDVARLMKQMQADYTKKTQEIAAQKKEMLREREALLKGYKAPEPKPLPEYDPYSEEAILARVQAEVDRRLAEVLAPAREEFEVLQAEAQYNEFVSANPDFESDQDLRAETQKILEADANIDLETAYWAAKGRLSVQRQRASQAKAAATREAARTAAQTATSLPRRPTGPAARPTSQDLKSMSTADILAAAQRLAGQRK